MLDWTLCRLGEVLLLYHCMVAKCLGYCRADSSRRHEAWLRCEYLLESYTPCVKLTRSLLLSRSNG